MINKLLSKLDKEIKELAILERDYLKLGNKIADHKMRLALEKAELQNKVKTDETDRTANNPRNSTGLQNVHVCAGCDKKEIKCNCMGVKEHASRILTNTLNNL